MYRNIPVISWLLQRGRADCCGARIPAWYVVSEATSVVTALAAAACWGWAGGLAAAVFMGVSLVAARRWHHDHEA